MLRLDRMDSTQKFINQIPLTDMISPTAAKLPDIYLVSMISKFDFTSNHCLTMVQSKKMECT